MYIGKINIVGADYKIYLHRDFNALQEKAKERDKRYNLEKEKWEQLDGYCDYSSKEINIYGDDYTDPKYFETTLRHELTHAFLFEIGNSNHDNEEFVDKISKWTPHIESLEKESLKLIKEGVKHAHTRSEKYQG